MRVRGEERGVRGHEEERGEGRDGRERRGMKRGMRGHGEERGEEGRKGEKGEKRERVRERECSGDTPPGVGEGVSEGAGAHRGEGGMGAGEKTLDDKVGTVWIT